jgi:hypothetical protein
MEKIQIKCLWPRLRGPFEIHRGPSLLSGPRTDVRTEPPSRRPWGDDHLVTGGLSYIYFHRDIKDRMCIYMNVLNPFTPLVYTGFF